MPQIEWRSGKPASASRRWPRRAASLAINQLLVALLNAVPYGEDIRRITIARNSTG